MVWLVQVFLRGLLISAARRVLHRNLSRRLQVLADIPNVKKLCKFFPRAIRYMQKYSGHLQFPRRYFQIQIEYHGTGVVTIPDKLINYTTNHRCPSNYMTQ